MDDGQLDSGAGLMYYRARHYDPQLGRFTQPDTIVPEPGNPQALNRYSYVLNNPIRYTDPTGHRECKRHCPQETIRPDINTAYAGPWNPAAQARRTQAARQATGAAIDFTPVVGDAKGLVEVFTGSDLVTGERLGAWRWLGLLGLSEVRHLRHADEVVAAAQGLGRITGSFDALRSGPLADELAGTFAGGRYVEVVLESDTVLYRSGTARQPLGQFFDPVPAASIVQTRIDKAILPRWPGGGKSPID